MKFPSKIPSFQLTPANSKVIHCIRENRVKNVLAEKIKDHYQAWRPAAATISVAFSRYIRTGYRLLYSMFGDSKSRRDMVLRNSII